MRLLVAAVTLVLTAGFSAAWEAPPVVAYEAAPPPPPPESIPAFPEARGHGALALAECRAMPLAVHQVTTTDHTGAGSLHDILDNDVRSDRYDVVVFRTGGMFEMGSTSDAFRFANLKCVYIAGQTAPGGGATFTSANQSGRFWLRRAEDVVLRGFRSSRAGAMAVYIQGGNRIVLADITARWNRNFGGGHNTIHLYGSNGSEQGVCTGNPCPLSNLTVQNSLLYEPHLTHPTLMHVSGDETLKADSATWNATIWGNAFIGPAHRGPNIRAHETQVISNINYNARDRVMEVNHRAEADFVDNWSKMGPGIGSGEYRRRLVGFRNADVPKSVYLSGNRDAFGDYAALTTASAIWSASTRQAVCNQPDGSNCVSQGDSVPSSWRRFAQLAQPYWAAEPLDLDSAGVDALLSTVGNSRGLAADGTWVTIRDSADSVRIAHVHAGTGPSTWVNVDTISQPTTAAGSPPTDTRGDGIPDAWMSRWGLTEADSAHHVTVSGYLLIEHYVNNSDPESGEPAGTPPDPGEPPAPITQTFGTGHRVYLVEVTVRSHALAPDSTLIPIMGPDPAVIPVPTRSITMAPPGSDSVLVCTLTDLGTPLDSAAVHAVMASWFATTAWRASYLRDQCP